MIGGDCPTPIEGPIPCPSTVDMHFDKIRKLLPRGIAWLSAWDPLQPMYQYFRAVAATFQWANDQFCQGIEEMFCSTRDWLAEDYLVEYGLPNWCNPNIDPCSLIPSVDEAKCSDLVVYAAAAGWALSCLPPAIVTASNCAYSGCSYSAAGLPAGQVVIGVDLSDSPVFTPGEPAVSGLGASGITVSGCQNEGPGTIDALECLISQFLPAHILFTLEVTP